MATDRNPGDRTETLKQSMIDAIGDHIERRRQDPRFQARLKEIRDEDVHILAQLAEGAKTDLGGPRLYFFLVHRRRGSL
jgi:hypothetical protein